MNTLSFDSQEKYNLCLFFTINVLNIYKYIQVVIAEEDVIQVVILYYEKLYTYSVFNTVSSITD